jgi:hypothetical protein
VDEAGFWKRLEWRIGDEFAGFADRHLRYYWCDGLVPDEYLLDGDRPCIRGRAWVLGFGDQHWEFTLYLGRDVRSREDIDWPALLPGDRLTGWLTPYPEHRTLAIDPLSGYDDRSP